MPVIVSGHSQPCQMLQGVWSVNFPAALGFHFLILWPNSNLNIIIPSLPPSLSSPHLFPLPYPLSSLPSFLSSHSLTSLLFLLLSLPFIPSPTLLLPPSERIVTVSEWYQDNLQNYYSQSPSTFSDPQALSRLAQQLLSALSYLQERGITHRGLAPENILVTPEVSFSRKGMLSKFERLYRSGLVWI